MGVQGLNSTMNEVDVNVFSNISNNPSTVFYTLRSIMEKVLFDKSFTT